MKNVGFCQVGSSNIDTSFHKWVVGFGAVVPDYLGKLIPFSYGRYEGVVSVHQVELMALRDGLSMMLARGLLVEFIECDVLFIVQDISNHTFNSTDCILVEAIVDLLSCVGSSICYHVSQCKNMVVHTLASMELDSSFVCLQNDDSSISW
ncbi:LOW QUALITY PROTEIN: hypothetical protein PanWU01x14_124090 [Parasponia andersonii]|uniref:RNase H type-1 domain-containing protein n=1 Tax=Parasponia andersonii TaxID=3476 RepID=A0A2P5CU08_PARAD|nr:LOW QUALITY PROTEIN: hypothetical protein PanWU01x14_124090 [Parasponia andersonii]